MRFLYIYALCDFYPWTRLFSDVVRRLDPRREIRPSQIPNELKFETSEHSGIKWNVWCFLDGSRYPIAMSKSCLELLMVVAQTVILLKARIKQSPAPEYSRASRTRITVGAKYFIGNAQTRCVEKSKQAHLIGCMQTCAPTPFRPVTLQQKRDKKTARAHMNLENFRCSFEPDSALLYLNPLASPKSSPQISGRDLYKICFGS